jgi:carboxyl-terminal processing protease
MTQPRARSPRTAASAAAAALVLLIGVWLGGHPGWIPSGLRGTFSDQSRHGFVERTLAVLEHDYYRKVNVTKLANAGLSAAVASLGDPYSHYFSPAAYRAYQNTTNPHLSGIGILATPDPRGLVVSEVYQRTPAARAGLVDGDAIIAVDGRSLAGLNADLASGMIRGKAGTSVTLTVVAQRRTRLVHITRAKINLPAASSKLLRYDGKSIGYLEFRQGFNDGSATQLRVQVDQVRQRGAQGLILDLRDNPGGLVTEAVNVASIFVPDGTIVSTAGRNMPRQVYVAHGGAISTKVPMVVLVDGGTASAAEIVTGALQDRGRAKVVGTHTYGKGVFQEIQTLSNGGALDITVGEYFTPSGRNLGLGGTVKRGAGIEPDVIAATKPRAQGDPPLTVAERTLAPEIR